MRLILCPHCTHHVLACEHVCPHCAGGLPAPTRPLAPTAAALLLGLLPIACTSTEKAPDKAETKDVDPSPVPIAEPEYGAPITEVPEPDSMPPAPAYGAPPTDSDGLDAKPMPDPGIPAEVEYGVAELPDPEPPESP